MLHKDIEVHSAKSFQTDSSGEENNLLNQGAGGVSQVTADFLLNSIN